MSAKLLAYAYRTFGTALSHAEVLPSEAHIHAKRPARLDHFSTCAKERYNIVWSVGGRRAAPTTHLISVEGKAQDWDARRQCLHGAVEPTAEDGGLDVQAMQNLPT
jgi:hypothetical protein